VAPKIPHAYRRRKTVVADGPLDGAGAKPPVGRPNPGREHEQRFEVDGLPVMAPDGSIDPELRPQARGEVEGEPAYLIA
jgi:hypothetical protein